MFKEGKTMKNKNLHFIALVCGVIALAACKNTNPPEQNPEQNLGVQLAVIKITPEIQNRIFVSPVVDSITIDYQDYNLGTLYYGDSLALCNTHFKMQKEVAFAQQKMQITGTNPYILLENGYAVIDWKWGLFHPLSGEYIKPLYWPEGTQMYSINPYYNNGALTNEEYYLLNTDWSDLKDLTLVWKKGEGTRIEKPEICYINVSKIEEYGHSDISHNDLREDFKTSELSLNKAYSLSNESADKCDAYIKFCNDLQACYVKILNEMITNNNLK